MKLNMKDKIKISALILIIFILSAAALQWREIYFSLVTTRKAEMIIKKQSNITTVQGNIIFDSARDWKPWSDRSVYVLRGGLIKKILSGADSHFMPKTNNVVFLNSAGVHIYDLSSLKVKDLKIHAGISSLSGYDVSPDGRQIVFVDGKYNKHGATIHNIHLINMDGTGLKQLTFFEGEYFFGYPRWSPNGQQILFNMGDRERKKPKDFEGERYAPSLFIINSDGSGLRNLLRETNAFGWHGSWSHDGKQIAFTLLTELGLTEIAVLDIATQTILQITKVPSFKEVQINQKIKEEFKKKVEKGHPIYKDYPIFSPDDTQVAFIGKSRGGYFSGSELFVLDAKGSEIQRLTAPHWTRMGWAKIISFDWAA